MCLNAAGVAYTEQRKSVITGLVLSITTEAYRESGLTERDNAMFIGTSLDELARHQPVLRPVLMQSLIQLLKNIAEAGKTGYSKGIKTPRDYRLVAPGSDDSASAPSASAESSQQQESTNSDQVMKDVTATHSEEKFDQVVEVAAKVSLTGRNLQRKQSN
jgi:E3 ubiquitin-protein ligase HUWE1